MRWTCWRRWGRLALVLYCAWGATNVTLGLQISLGPFREQVCALGLRRGKIETKLPCKTNSASSCSRLASNTVVAHTFRRALTASKSLTVRAARRLCCYRCTLSAPFQQRHRHIHRITSKAGFFLDQPTETQSSAQLLMHRNRTLMNMPSTESCKSSVQPLQEVQTSKSALVKHVDLFEARTRVHRSLHASLATARTRMQCTVECCL